MAKLNILPSSSADLQRRNGNGKRRSLARTILLVLLCITAISSFSLILFSNSTASRYLNLGTCCTWGGVVINGASESMLEHNFAVVIDAGSSGSRVFVYHWPRHDGDPSHLLKIDQLFKNGAPVVKKVNPGLSTFANSPQDAYAHLKPLLDFAKDHIPVSKQEATLLYVLATAGMRLLPLENQLTIMTHIHSMIKSEYNFYLPESSIEVISGKLEGVYSWITINYLLGKFDVSQHSLSEDGSPTINTVGSIDMGGGSIQAAFEIPEDMYDVPSCRVVEINLGCGIKDRLHKHRVYVTTFLGYGANEALRMYMTKRKNDYQNTNRTTRNDPCLPLNMKYQLSTSKISLVGAGDYSGCRKALMPLLSGEKQDKVVLECSEDKLYELPANFTAMPFYGFSEFWYTMSDVLGLGGDYRKTLFDNHAAKFCHTSWEVSRQKHREGLYPRADTHRLKYQCFKSSWMSLVLHNALGFPGDHSLLQSANKIQGRNVQWTLGALLYRTRFMPLRYTPFLFTMRYN